MNVARHAIDAIGAIVDAEIRQKHLEKRNAAPVRRVGMAYARARDRPRPRRRAKSASPRRSRRRRRRNFWSAARIEACDEGDSHRRPCSCCFHTTTDQPPSHNAPPEMGAALRQPCQISGRPGLRGIEKDRAANWPRYRGDEGVSVHHCAKAPTFSSSWRSDCCVCHLIAISLVWRAH